MTGAAPTGIVPGMRLTPRWRKAILTLHVWVKLALTTLMLGLVAFLLYRLDRHRGLLG
jgi:hypothetical protein